MRTLGSGNAAQIERIVRGTWVRVRVADHLGAMQTHSPFEVEYEQPSGDTPIGQATVKIRRGQGVSSYAPLMTADPPIDVGRRFEIAIDAGSGSWTPVFEGRVDFVSWPERYGDVTFRGRDLLGMAADQWITEERAYGSEAGVPLEDVIQAVIEDNWDASYGTAPTLDSETTGAVVLDDPDPYVPSEVSIYDAAQSLAESIGAVVHERWTGAAFEPSLIEPEREKTTPDHTFAPSGYYEVTAMEQDVEDIRNDVEVAYGAEGAGLSESATDSASIAKYGRRYMRITEASDSPIRDASGALALAQAAVSDLAEPDATLEIQCAYFWPGEVGVDLYRFTANGIHFSADQDLAPVSITHRLTVGQRAETVLRVRGRPSAGVLLWRRRSRGPVAPVPPEATKILAVDLVEQTATLDTWRVTMGAAVEEGHVYARLFDSPDPPADWRTTLYAEANFLTLIAATGDEFSTARPAEGTCLAIGVLPMAEAASGAIEMLGDGLELLVQGGTAALEAEVTFVRLTSTTERIDVTLEDPRGVAGTPQLTIGLRDAVAGPFALTFAAGVWSYTYTLDPDHPLILRLEIPRTDGNPSLMKGPYTADFDELPGIPSVREVRIVDQASVYVDAADTDTASLHYVEVVGGAPGAEVDILPRGSDPRFGAFTVTAGADSRSFRVYGRNAAGDAGEYREVVVTRYIPVESAGVMREQITEDDSAGTLTLVPIDGAAFDEVEFATRTGSGAWTSYAEDVSAPYEQTITKDPKHTSAIAYRVSLGGVVIQERIVAGFDIGTIANVMDALPTYDRDAGEAGVRVLFDLDQAIGTGEAGYRLDGGSETLVDVDANREALITVTLSTTAEILMEVRGYNVSGTPGPWFALTLERHKVQPASFARIISLTAVRQSPGNCGLGTHLTNRITPEFQDTVVGDVWDLLRFEDGVEAALVGSNIPVSDTEVDDVLTGFEETSLGAPVAVVYRAYLTPAAGGMDAKDSPPLTQEWQACP